MGMMYQKIPPNRPMFSKWNGDIWDTVNGNSKRNIIVLLLQLHFLENKFNVKVNMALMALMEMMAVMGLMPLMALMAMKAPLGTLPAKDWSLLLPLAGPRCRRRICLFHFL